MSMVFTDGQNLLINGGFDFWQRGDSFTADADENYTADRWIVTTGTGSVDVGQGAAPAQSSSEHSMKLSNGASAGDIYVVQRVEAQNTPQTMVTVSARVQHSSQSDFAPTLRARTPLTTKEDWSAIGEELEADLAIVEVEDGWNKVVYSTDLSALAGVEYGVELSLKIPAVDMNTDDEISIADVKVERGVVATPFTRAGGGIGGELALCQRYYYRIDSKDNAYQTFQHAHASGSANIRGITFFPVTMRDTPSIEHSDLSAIYFDDGVNFNLSALASSDVNSNGGKINWTTTGATRGNTGVVRAHNTNSAYLAFDAEL